MATRTLFRRVAASLTVAVVWAACARGQQWYAGPGAIVQQQVTGPYVQPVYPYAGPGPRFPSPLPVPRVYVPAPGPYRYGPVIVPLVYPYAVNRYQPGICSPAAQPYRGYQPTGPAPRFGDPIVPSTAQARPAAPQATKPAAPAAKPRAQQPKSEKTNPKTPAKKTDPADKPAQQVMPAH